MGTNSIVTEYVDAAVAQARPLLVPVRDMPHEMRDDSVSPVDDWIGWRPVKSTVTTEDIAELEDHFGGSLPQSYVAFLKYAHFYELTERGVRFEQHVIGPWKADLMRLYDWFQPLLPETCHLVPFGSETFMDAGPVCFDYANRLNDDDCPIVFWDHEWVNTEREVQPMFSSCAKMFESLLFVAKAPIDFLYHDPDYHAKEDLPKKRHLLSQFLAIDPDGSGGPARDYWTCWGVTPDS